MHKDKHSIYQGKDVTVACDEPLTPQSVCLKRSNSEQAGLGRDGKISSDRAEANDCGCLGTRVLGDGTEAEH